MKNKGNKYTDQVQVSMNNTPIKEKFLTLNFAALFGVTFLTFFSLDLFIPVLPFYIVDRGGGEEVVGMLMGIFIFFSVILRPYQGEMSNRQGRKRILLLGIAAYALSGLGLLTMPSLPVLFLIRSLQGIGWGAFLLAFNTMTLDMAPPTRRGEAVGLMGIAPPLSLAAAPLLGDFLRTGSGSYPLLFIISFVTALAAILIALLIKEPPPEQADHERGPLLSGKVLLPSLMIFCITFTFGGLITFLPLLGEQRGFASVGAFFTVFALTSIAVRPFAGKLSDRFGRAFVFLPGLAVLCVSLATIALSGSMELLLLGGLLFGCGMGSAHPAIMALAADRLAAGERGVGIATFTIAFDMGILAGAVLLGLLLTRFGFTDLFLIGAAIALLPALIYISREIMTSQP